VENIGRFYSFVQRNEIRIGNYRKWMVEFPFWTEDVHEKNEETIDVSLSGEDEHTDDEDV
jgi:hypothetical protein